MAVQLSAQLAPEYFEVIVGNTRRVIGPVAVIFDCALVTFISVRCAIVGLKRIA
jgi:hypothetical protein